MSAQPIEVVSLPQEDLTFPSLIFFPKKNPVHFIFSPQDRIDLGDMAISRINRRIDAEQVRLRVSLLIADSGEDRAKVEAKQAKLELERKSKIGNIQRELEGLYKNPWDQLSKGRLRNPADRKLPTDPLVPATKPFI